MKIISQLQRGYKKLEIFISLYQFLLIGQVYAMTYSGELYYRIIDSLLFFWWRCLKMDTTGDVFFAYP